MRDFVSGQKQKSTHGLGNMAQRLNANRVKLKFVRVTDEVPYALRETDAPGRRYLLKPCRNIDVITKSLVSLNHDGTLMDADPGPQLFIFREMTVSECEILLQPERRLCRRLRRWKNRKQTVSGCVDQGAIMI